MAKKCKHCGRDISPERMDRVEYCSQSCVVFASVRRTEKEFPNLVYDIALRRKEILKIKGNKCYFCEKKDKLHIHHKTYESNELKNLLILCPRCHSRLHVILPKVVPMPPQNALQVKFEKVTE